MALSKQLEAARRQLAEAKADAVRRVLSTPDGQALLEVLSPFADGDLIGDSHDETLANLGAREVVMYLRRLVKLSEVVERTGR